MRAAGHLGLRRVRAVLAGCLGLLAWSLAHAAGGVSAAGPAAVDDRGHRIALERPPLRIVTLAPALTESVCVLGACARLVGTDRHSNWPEPVRALPKLGVLEEAQVERIVALRPDLVLATASVRAVARLEQLGLKVAQLEPRTLGDTRRVLEQVAQLLGRPASTRRPRACRRPGADSGSTSRWPRPPTPPATPRSWARCSCDWGCATSCPVRSAPFRSCPRSSCCANSPT
jgi:iron complex transport system substrate-binding protein